MRVTNRKIGLKQVVPCGKCPNCRDRRAQDWIIRLQAEEKRHASSLFVTLTYSPENTRVTSKKLMTLSKVDVQLFMKRLRKNTGRKKLKYYAVGEYGGTTSRPHYHLIMFDVGFDEIYQAWGLGQIHVGQVSGESIAYTCKYICKPKKIPAFAGDDRQTEFSLMSKNLGNNYLTPEMIEYHQDTGNSFVYQPGGFKKALPRYYRDRIFSEEQKELMMIASQADASRMLEDRIRDAGGSQLYYHNRQEGIIQAMKSFKTIDQKRNKV